MILAVGLALLGPAAARAHVTVELGPVSLEGRTTLRILVPGERADAGTARVEVQLPDGFHRVEPKPEPDWSVDVRTRDLERPAPAPGGEVTEVATAVVLAADSPEFVVQPGQTRDFELRAGLTDDAAALATLIFPATQIYSNGDVVDWTGPPGSAEPAAELARSESGYTPVDGSAAGHGLELPAATGSGADEGDGGVPTWLVLGAAALGAVALGAGIARLRR